jgi:predicted ATPase
MPTADDIAQQQALLAAHRRTLAALLQQHALFGAAHAPPSLVNGIDDARASIARSKATLRAWGVAVEDHLDDQAPGTSTPLGSPILHQLRPPVSDFVGHEQILDYLVKELWSRANTGRPALAVIRGMGGAGKTELALVLAQRLHPHFPDAQVLIELRGASERPLTSVQALQSVIRAFQSPERLPEDRAMLEAQYRALLTGKRVLILADDAKDAAQVRSLLPPAGCVLLLTSRNRFALPGLQSEQILDLEGLPSNEAVMLLRAICPRVRDRALDLAQRCDFLPLALRISASLLASDATRRLDRYLQQLADERERLAALRDPDDPSLDVAASLALSYDALDQVAQTTLQQCAVFVGSFDPAAAQATIRLPADNGTTVEDALSTLYRRSLVGYDTVAERYQLHDLVRAFAATQLTPPVKEDTRRRHAEYYLALVQPADGEQAWFDRLTREYSNIRAALDWSLGQDNDDAGIRSIGDLYPFWRNHGQLSEGRAWLERALHKTAQASTSVRALLLTLAGRLASDQEDLKTARRYYTESLELRRALGQRRGVAVQMENLGWITFLEGDYAEARRLTEQALETYRELGLQQSVAGALVQLASITRAQHAYEETTRLCEEALELSHKLNDPYGIAQATLRLGRVADDQGNDALARRYFEDCLAFFRTFGRRGSIAFTLSFLGRVVYREGNVKRAIASFEESAAIYTEIGNLTRAAHSLDWLSHIAFLEGHEQAELYTLQCLDRYRAIPDSEGTAKILLRLGDLARKNADEAAALSHYRESLLLYQTLDDREGQLRCLDHLAVLAGSHAPERVARLLAATTALRADMGAELDPLEREERERLMAALRADLGEEAFTAAWNAGQQLTLEQATAEARLLPPLN